MVYGVRCWSYLNLFTYISKFCSLPPTLFLPPSLSPSLSSSHPPSHPPSLSPSLPPSLSLPLFPPLSALQDFCNSENHDASSAVQQVTETDHLEPLRDTLTLLSVLHEYAQHGESSEHSTEVTDVDYVVSVWSPSDSNICCIYIHYICCNHTYQSVKVQYTCSNVP